MAADHAPADPPATARHIFITRPRPSRPRAGVRPVDVPPPTARQIFFGCPRAIEAVQWTGDNLEACLDVAPGCVECGLTGLRLLASKNGDGGWVDVPEDGWLVRSPGDTT